MSNDKWKRVNRKNKCPVCGHDSWCAIGQRDGTVLCMRMPGGRPVASGGWLHGDVVEMSIDIHRGEASKRQDALSHPLYNTSREWKRQVFDLVRHVRHDQGGTDQDARRALAAWHRRHRNPPDFNLALAYAVQCWDRAKQGTDADALAVACKQAMTGRPTAPMPGIVGLVWRVCHYLSIENPVFYLSCNPCGRALGVPSMHVWRALRCLVDGDHIAVVAKGDRFTAPAAPGEKRRPARATRYRMVRHDD